MEQKKKSWEIPENSHILGGGCAWGIKIRAGSSKGAAAAVFKEQRDQKREIKSGCGKLQPILPGLESENVEEEGKSRAAAQRTQCRAGSSSRGQKRN